MKFQAIFLVFLMLVSCTTKEGTTLPGASREDEGQAALFAEGIVSTHLNEYNITFSPEGNLALFTVANNSTANRFYTIFIVKKINGRWTKPQIASFSGQYSDADPFFAPDGRKLYFISRRPVLPGILKADFDIWCVDYSEGSFGLPKHLDNTINTDKDELYPAISNKGNLFFSGEQGENGYDILKAEYRNGAFLPPESLPGSSNTKAIEFDAFVDPEEKFIIYTGMDYEDGEGSGDLYISFNADGSWQRGQNLGKAVNSLHMEQCPTVSADGKFLYFTSFREGHLNESSEKMSTKMYLSKLNSPLNGLGDIFRIDFKKIRDVKKRTSKSSP